MIERWADHCSSDEESLDDAVSPSFEEVDQPEDPKSNQVDNPPEDQDEGVHEEPKPIEKQFDLPDHPPFTAFVGNLAFSVKEEGELTSAIADAVQQQLGQTINIIGGRVAFDRTGKHRGFGYVEVESLEELKLVLTLNSGQTMIAGRKIQVDTANRQTNQGQRRGNRQNNFDRRRGGGPPGGDHPGTPVEIDGSKFRGGRYNNNHNNSHRNKNHDGNKGNTNEAGPPQQRPSLKLAPRTKPRDDEKNQGSHSNIFGGAVARDESAWEKRRRSKQEEESKQATSTPPAGKESQPDQRKPSAGRGGRGGTGRGRGTGGSGRGRGADGSASNTNQNNPRRKTSNAKRNPQQQSPEEKAAAAAAAAASAAAAAPEKIAAPATPADPIASKKPDAGKPAAPAKKPLNNSFAALMDSDSD